MEIAISSSLSSLETPMLSCASTHSRTVAKPISARSFSNPRLKFTPKASLSTSFTAPFVGGSVSCEIIGNKLSVPSLKLDSACGRRGKKGVVTMVIPFLRGNAWEQPPPDLASYLYKNRIVYLGMSLVPSVTELILAEFLYLQYEDETKPIYLYINSTGTTKGGEKLGYETEAFAIYDVMRYVKPPIFTLCVGNAWGEAALLLAAGAKGNRAALPSSTIMIKEPIARFQGQATDVELARKEIKNVKKELRRKLTVVRKLQREGGSGVVLMQLILWVAQVLLQLLQWEESVDLLLLWEDLALLLLLWGDQALLLV